MLMGPYPCGIDMRPGSCDCQLPKARVRMLRIQLVFNISRKRSLGSRVFGWHRRVPARMPPSSYREAGQKGTSVGTRAWWFPTCRSRVQHLFSQFLRQCDALSGDDRLSIFPVLCKRSLPGVLRRVQLYFGAVPSSGAFAVGE